MVCSDLRARAEPLAAALAAEHDAIYLTPARSGARLRRLQIAGADGVASPSELERKYAEAFIGLRALRCDMRTDRALVPVECVAPIGLDTERLTTASADFCVRVLVDAMTAHPALEDVQARALGLSRVPGVKDAVVAAGTASRRTQQWALQLLSWRRCRCMPSRHPATSCEWCKPSATWQGRRLHAASTVWSAAQSRRCWRWRQRASRYCRLPSTSMSASFSSLRAS